jgi:aryl-alcohol dehydrogenase-like predicted oxidoreductase
MVATGAFGVNEARASLETSLREIGTDYLDFYLLHDYVVTENPPDELLEFLAAAVKSGKIRYFGLGTGIENILRALDTQPSLCGILQFENSVLARNLEKIPVGGPQRLVITFGSLSASYHAVAAFLKAHGELARSWSAKLGMDCSREETISALMLNYAASKNSNGLVLFSSRDEARTSRNVKAVLESRISPQQAETFGQLVAREMMPALRPA